MLFSSDDQAGPSSPAGIQSSDTFLSFRHELPLTSKEMTQNRNPWCKEKQAASDQNQAIFFFSFSLYKWLNLYTEYLKATFYFSSYELSDVHTLIGKLDTELFFMQEEKGGSCVVEKSVPILQVFWGCCLQEPQETKVIGACLVTCFT